MLHITIGLPADLVTPPCARVQLEGDALPEYGQVWIWDMFYARTAHALAGSEALRQLREDLEVWGVNLSSKLFQPFDHVRSKGHLVLHKGFSVEEGMRDADTRIRLDVSIEAKAMPRMELCAGEFLTKEQRAAAVTALAQYFIDRNELFAKELPLHILAFRKFYGDVAPEDDPSSVEDAPMFAIQKALEYFNSVAQGARH